MAVVLYTHAQISELEQEVESVQYSSDTALRKAREIAQQQISALQ